MFKNTLSLLDLISTPHRHQLLRLQFWVVISAMMEFISLASIVPFIALIGDSAYIYQSGLLFSLFNLFGFEREAAFISLVGLGIFLLLSFSMALSLLTLWRLSILASRIGAEIADCLYVYYITRPWLFHSTHSSAELNKQISTESVRVTHGFIQPLIQLNARLVLVVVLGLGLFWVNPWLALAGLLVFGLAYGLVYFFVRRQVYYHGEQLSNLATERYRLMLEGFGGIRDILLSHRQGFFARRFVDTSEGLAQAIGRNNALVLVPRFIVEWLAFGLLVAVASIWLVFGEQSLVSVLPSLVFFALVAFKLLPALQQVYANLTVMKGNLAAFESIEADLQAARLALASDSADKPCSREASSPARLCLKQGVRFRSVCFDYPQGSRPALVNIDVSFGAKQTIGLVGASGSGKSTLADLLLGLIRPTAGEIQLDGVSLSDGQIDDWQSLVGFVPQSIFLSSGSIADNVAFGIEPELRDQTAIVRALELAQLWDWVCSLPEGLDSEVGERGVQLSGGQRQRIGIARALYRDAEVLVLDEATSALDGVTEREVMNAIVPIRGQKLLVIIAHRIKTVKDCDVIFVLDQGRVIAQGDFASLYASCAPFRELADHG
ncbi:ABC transporter ATP-binding protein [Thiomicrospira microaerophila]|uniref:ABC transporter ATP-binding protein n=1 Tax=Thiomicrospira microaerophila TaxID=406020 RepID=UPI00200DD080|nr:ABC transporter ATP-binding protein [Thiomicrospira microaerophila]UQB42414.1 ABC transporter ATP-binding protein [Thiomicrospira microaerophila]